ncbi:MAG TPA: bifunctional diaminohydroxyphosphoribosylaminopyrimidine deaminase/5-amino-6-(5-phosphoribosylamino)uracil reductase RibD [Sutterella sp.]|nr:bifunctional diaminohydroxyphosphoribosylaminopyrimidine deaminase/5-amino-6-(5-phosphoribosylamino)uracil reductase RibD [Sutterella sp.]
MMSCNDVYWMHEALKEGRKALPLCAPNPAVGCVLVRDGKEISRGHTQRPGGNHAEIEAIEAALKAQRPVRGATAYVTLEPCSHQGRTPACAKRLIAEGIGRVVYAVKDPNPLVCGKGDAMLREAGIAVLSGVCEDEAREAHAGFFSHMMRRRPWVRLKTAASLDGRTALENGVSQWITGSAAREDAHRYRALSQGILTGIGTILADNPQLNVRLTGEFINPTKYIIDPRAQTPIASAVLGGAKTVLFVSSAAPKDSVAALKQAGAEILTMPTDQSGHFDLKRILETIDGRGVNDLLLETGARLSGAFLQAGLVDELLVYMAPALIGPGMPFANMDTKTRMDQVDRWRFVSVTPIGDDVRLILKKKTEHEG